MNGFEFHVNGPPEFVALVLIVVVLPIYFIPTVIALARRCRLAGPVLIINLLLGWTVIGWVVALAMAFGSSRRDSQVGWTGHLSPDGRYWWDGTRWRDIPPPPGTTWGSPPAPRG